MLRALFYSKPQQTEKHYLENTCTETHTHIDLHLNLLGKLVMKQIKTVTKRVMTIYDIDFLFFFLETEIGSRCLGPATSDTPLLSLCNKCVKVMNASPMLGCEAEVILFHTESTDFPLKPPASKENALIINHLLLPHGTANM